VEEEITMQKAFAVRHIGTMAFASALVLMAAGTLGVLLLPTAGWAKHAGAYGGDGGGSFQS
jgi:hypothetical protein